MTDALAALFSTGRVADLILALLAIEVAALLVYRLKTGRGIAPADLPTIFQPFFRMRRELPSPFDTAPRYRVQVEDRLWHALYLPIAAAVRWTADLIGVLQQGRIALYLTYSFATLLVLLVVML